MSLFFDFHTDRLPPGSFQTPVQPPALAPGAEPLVTLCINQEWIPFILGAFQQLTMNTTWSGTDAEIQAARQEANDLILIFQQALRGCPARNAGTSGAGDDFMLRQNPDNPCELQTSVDGVNWCTWADLSKCTPNSQPAQGTKPTPPGGGCTMYTGEASIGHAWSLPNQVSTGDVITVTNANGLWASPLDLFLSRCPDGNLWFELACVEGTGHTEPGDPAPTINHDSLIAFDGTNYYDCGAASDGMPAVITIPGGISNQNLVFMCNTPDASGTGNVVFEVQYCNNAVASWSHTFDFASNSGGWLPQADGGSANAGVWTPGVGWEPSDVTQSGGDKFRRVHINKAFSARDITGVTVFFSLTKGTYQNPSTDFGLLAALPNIAGTPEISLVANALSSASGQVAAGAVPLSGQTSIDIYLSSCDTLGAFDGSCLVTKVIIDGTGTDPF